MSRGVVSPPCIFSSGGVGKDRTNATIIVMSSFNAYLVGHFKDLIEDPDLRALVEGAIEEASKLGKPPELGKSLELGKPTELGKSLELGKPTQLGEVQLMSIVDFPTNHGPRDYYTDFNECFSPDHGPCDYYTDSNECFSPDHGPCDYYTDSNECFSPDHGPCDYYTDLTEDKKSD